MSKKQQPKKKKMFLILTLFSLFGIIVGISEKHLFAIIFYAFFAVLFFYLWNKSKKETPAAQEPASTPKVEIPTQNIQTPIEPQIEAIDISDFVEPAKPKEVETKPESPVKIERLHIAGTSYRKEEIESLGTENSIYDYSKKELIEECIENERIYFYDFYPSKVELIEEPDNPTDANAIKVIIDNVHVGYIKSGSCSHVKKLIRSGKIQKIKAEIHGGKYKILYCDDDYDEGEDVYELDKDETNYSVTIELYIEQ